MPPQRKTVLHGITEIGAVVGGSDESWGATEPNGLTIQIDGEDVDVQSGQSLMLEDSFAAARRIDVIFRLQYSDLANLRDALGMPTGALTGDLQSAQAEVLAFLENNIGSEEQHLYGITPGPVSTRRYDFHRCKQRGGITLEHGSRGYVVLETRWGVLKPTSGNVVTVTDAP